MKNQYSRRVWPYASMFIMAGALLIAAPITAWAAHLGGAATHASPRKSENVRITLHNLSTSNPIEGTNIVTAGTGTTEVCVFCHTPHGANEVGGSAPLWNRALPTTTGYSMYTAPNFDATTSTAPVGVSLACLSCHDGTIAVDALINAPGSGGFRSINLVAGTSTSIGLIDAVGSFLDTENRMNAGLRTDTGTNYVEFSGGASPFPNLTKDLEDDHPISFEYPTVGEDPQFVTQPTTFAGNVKLVAGNNQTQPLDERDVIRTYPPNGDNTFTSGQGWVECASCHNPHAARPLFLRLPNLSGTAANNTSTTIAAVTGVSGTTLLMDDPNVGSAICLTCHDK